MRKLLALVWKVGLIAAGSAVAWGLALKLGAWGGVGAYAVLMGGLCTAAALLLRAAPVGEIGWRNRLAGYVLPWGYSLGRGKLAGITVAAWVIWVVIGVAAVVATRPGGRWGPAVAGAGPTTAPVVADVGGHPVMAGLLLASWVLYGALIVRLVGCVLKQLRENATGRRTMLQVTAVMLGLIGVSAALWATGHVGKALLVAGGPVVLVGGGYGLVIVVMLIAKPNFR